jgi:ABC-2 type transport system permease protein
VTESPVGTRSTFGLRATASLFSAFILRDFRIALSYRLAFVTQLVGMLTNLFFLYFLGRLISSTSVIHLGHTPALQQGYFSYAVLGVALLGIVNTELGQVSSQIRADQTTGTLEALLAMPPPAWLTVVGGVAYSLLWATFTGLLSIVFAALGFGLHFNASLPSALMALAGLFVALILFAGFGVAFASAVVVFKRGGALGGGLGTAFSLLGSVYYPLSVLPSSLRYLADALPFTWAVTIIRGGLLERRVFWSQFAILCLATAVIVPVSLAVFSAAVRYSRSKGTLGQY